MKIWREIDGEIRKSEKMERLGSGKVGMYLKESSMNKWNGWHVFGAEFNEKMEWLGCT